MGQIPIFTRRRALYLIGGVAGGITLHACAQSSTSPTPEASPEASATPESTSTEPVKTTTGSTLWIGYTPLYVGLEKGFFLEEGLDLDHKVLSSSGEGDAAFAAGRLDGENTVTSEAVALAAKGQDYRIIQVADSSLGGDGILARNSIKDVADFKGKEIAVDVGGVSHFFLLQVLEEAGLSSEDVTIVNLTPDAAAAAYQAGRVEIAVTYSPFLKQANDAQPDGQIIYDTSKMPTAIVDVYLFSTQFVEEHPKAVEGYVRGIYKAIDFIKSNPEEAYTLAGKWLELSPEEVETELQGVDLTSLENNIKMLDQPDSGIYLVDHMHDLGTFLKDQGQIPDAPTLEQLKQLIDPTFVKAVAVA
jgi:NitT/TauT family transport system substrate-binding protein